jgi:hypothetical protein
MRCAEKRRLKMIKMQAGDEAKVIIHYRAIATTTAPPTMATISRAIPVGRAAALVCRPGLPAAVPEGLPVASGVMTVMEVMVLWLPSGMVVVLLEVEVVRLVCSVVRAEVVVLWVVVEVEVDEVLLVVDRVEGTLVVSDLVVWAVEDVVVAVVG